MRSVSRGSILACVILGACASPGAAPAPVAAPTARAAPPAPASASAQAAPAPPSEPPTACKPLAPGTTSDDESPTLGGTTGTVSLLEWLLARDVSHDVAIAWLAARYGIAKDRAENFAYAPCGEVKLGEPSEAAIVCEVSIPASLVQRHALALVVRGKRPAAVLDVGVGIVAMDFPDAHWLDLSVLVAADGKSIELKDRAPEGTLLVDAPSRCRAEEKHVAECEKKLAAHPNPESLAHPAGKHEERIDSLDDCPLYRKAGTIAVFRRTNGDSPIGILPAKLHDCAGGRAGLEAMQRELTKAPADARAEARQSLVFYDKTCAQRGRYAWQKDRFVKAVR